MKRDSRSSSVQVMQRYSSRNEITPAERHKLRNLHLAPAAEPGELRHVADNRIANAFSSR